MTSGKAGEREASKRRQERVENKELPSSPPIEEEGEGMTSGKAGERPAKRGRKGLRIKSCPPHLP